MNQKLMDNIIFKNKDEENKLKIWCEYIGYNRYISICDFIKNEFKLDKVKYQDLVEIVKYDFKLADIIFSVIKFIEYYLRATISNKYGDYKLDKKEYLYQITYFFTGGKKKIPCDIKYDSKLKNSCTLDEYLFTSTLNTLIKIFKCLPDNILNNFKFEGRKLEEDLDLINKIRNDISHGRTLIEKNVNLSKKLITVFVYIPSLSIKDRFLQSLKEVYEVLNNNISTGDMLKNSSIDISELMNLNSIK